MIEKFIVALILALLFSACKQKTKEVKPEMRTLTQAVYASGTLQPEKEYKVVAFIDGYLQQSLVKEGDSVRKGELLFRLDNSIKEAQVNAAYELAQKTAPLSSDQSPLVKELQTRMAATEAK